jgi:hypothetical protein
VAQVCERGHMVNSNARRSPEHNERHCSRCGAATITVCPSCSTPIRGDYHVEGAVFLGGPLPTPPFCHECGQPYPWTMEGMETAKRLVQELDGLKGPEKDALTKSLEDIVRDTPGTKLAVLQVKKFLLRAKGPAASALRDVLLTVATEAAKKALLGP